MLTLPLATKRSIIISKPAAEVFTTLSDFRTWRYWSPWLCQEPDCPLTIKEEPGQLGHSQHWDGSLIGAGTIKLIALVKPHRLEYQLTFLRPWKSQSNVFFDIKENGTDTEVSWEMQGTLPIFLFFMRKTLAASVSSDYERGLTMLKEYIETGEVLSKTDIIKDESCEGFYYVGKRRNCNLQEIATAIPADFNDLNTLIKKGALPKPDLVFSFYHQYDMVNQRCDYTSGFGYKKMPEAPKQSPLVSGHIEAHTALRVNHRGSYRHLGNAWSAAQSSLRTHNKKAVKRMPMYEIYANFPGEIADRDILTKIHIPVA